MIINETKLKTKEDARQYAINYQNWASEQNLSYGEIAEHQAIFSRIATKFNLVREFKENGII